MMSLDLTIRKPKSDREWRSTTGFDEGRFLKLSAFFVQGYSEIFGRSYEERLADQPNDSVLKTSQDLLFFTLFVLKSGVTFDVLGYIYGLNQSNCQRNYKIGLQTLEKGLQAAGVFPKRSFENPEDFAEYFSGQKVLVLDATEQRIQRPKDNEFQKEVFSGKKKSHR
jgi:hypothetical protein